LAAALVAAHEAEDNKALDYAVRLAASLSKKHFPEVPQWRPLDNIIGVLTQIDNMTCALSRAAALQERVRLLEATLTKCADDLESEIKYRYGENIHRALQRKFDADMQIIVSARAVLGESS